MNEDEIIKRTQGIDPKQLSKRDRNIVSSAYEIEALRMRMEMLLAIDQLEREIRKAGALITIKQ